MPQNRLEQRVDSPAPELVHRVAICMDLHAQAIWLYPELKGLGVVSASADRKQKWYRATRYPGYFSLDEDENPVISVQFQDPDYYRKMMRRRPHVLDEMLRMMDLKPGILAEYPDLVPLLVYGHELGHAFHFETEFAGKRSDHFHPGLRWSNERDAELATLPIPGRDMLPSRMTVAGIEPYYYANKAAWNDQGIGSVRELMRHQEEAYRHLPQERFADTFAARLLMLCPVPHAVLPELAN